MQIAPICGKCGIYAWFYLLLQIFMIKFTSCSNITFIDGYVNIFINKSKTDQYRQGNENPISAGITSDCPVKMLQRYISLGNINTFLVIVLLKSVFKFKEGLKLTKTKKQNIVLHEQESACYQN